MLFLRLFSNMLFNYSLVLNRIVEPLFRWLLNNYFLWIREAKISKKIVGEILFTLIEPKNYVNYFVNCGESDKQSQNSFAISISLIQNSRSFLYLMIQWNKVMTIWNGALFMHVSFLGIHESVRLESDVINRSLIVNKTFH